MGTRPVLMVDFNDVDENRHVPVLLVLENAGVSVSVGDVVELRDNEDNRVEGYVVDDADPQRIIVAPEWGRWNATKDKVVQKTGEPNTVDLLDALMSSARFSVPTSGSKVVA